MTQHSSSRGSIPFGASIFFSGVSQIEANVSITVGERGVAGGVSEELWRPGWVCTTRPGHDAIATCLQIASTTTGTGASAFQRHQGRSSCALCVVSVCRTVLYSGFLEASWASNSSFVTG